MDFLNKLLLAASSLISIFSPQPTFTEGLVGQPVNIAPPYNQTRVDRELSRLVFKGLASYGPSGEIIPDLAESWEISEDGKNYTVVLREGIYWHDGVPITSDDVLYTASQSPDLKNIAVDRLDDKTVRFYLNDPFSPFLSVLTQGIIPAHIPEMDPFSPVGCGDYKVLGVKKDVLVSSITLAAVAPDAYFKKIKIKFYLSEDDLETAAKLGEIDAYGGWMISGWEIFDTYEAPLFGRYYGIFFNLSSGKEILKDKEFRRNLASKIPRKVIVQEALRGAARLVQGPLEGSWAHDPSVIYPKYDPSLSDNYDVKLTITVPDKPIHVSTAQIIKESWQDLGVDLTIRPEPLETFQEKIINSRDFELILLGQEISTPDPDRYVLWHSTQTRPPGLNITGFEAVRSDKALELGRKVLDQGERQEHYTNFQRILAEETPVIYLYQPLYSYFVKKNIKGISLGNMFFSQDRWRGIKGWKR